MNLYRCMTCDHMQEDDRIIDRRYYVFICKDCLERINNVPDTSSIYKIKSEK